MVLVITSAQVVGLAKVSEGQPCWVDSENPCIVVPCYTCRGSLRDFGVYGLGGQDLGFEG